MSTNLSDSSPHGPPGMRDPVGVGRSVGTPGCDPYGAWVVGRIAALIRSARSEPEFIPVGPERRRLRSLMNGWLAVLPLVVVLFEVIRRILAHYYSLEDLEKRIQTWFGWADADSFFLWPFVYFIPAGALGTSLIFSFGSEAAARIFRSPQARFTGYRIALCLAGVAVVLTVGVAFWIAVAKPGWFAVIVLTCFYIVPLAHLAYVVISTLTNSTRSLRDYAVGILVFVAAVFAAFSMLIGTEAIAEAKLRGQAAGKDVAGVAVGDNELGHADAKQKNRSNGESPALVALDNDGFDSASDAPASGGAGSPEENYWILVPFFVVVLVGAGVTMWNYHAFLLWRRFGRSYAAHISELAKNAVPLGGGLGINAHEKLCRKIGQQLGPKLSGSPAAEYSVYICSAASPLGLRLSSSVKGVGHEVSDPAVSAGVRGVFAWVSEDKREWTTACHQYLYIKVSEGIASHIYDSAVKCGKRWPFVIDADVLACSRLLAATVADSVYRSGLYRLMPRLAGETSQNGRAKGGSTRLRIWWRHMGTLCACCDPFR